MRLGDSRMVARESMRAVVGVRRSELERDAPAAGRHDEHVAVRDPLRTPPRGLDADVAENCPEHDSGLGQREGGANASSRSAAERNPAIGAGTGIEESLRPKAEWFGIELGTTVHERDVRDDDGAAWMVSPGNSNCSAASRAVSGKAGRNRIVSLITASRYSSSP